MSGTVSQLYSQAELASALDKASGALVVVDWSANFCGPCKKLAPFYDGLAKKHTDVRFYKVIMEEAQEFVHSVGIGGFPTIHFYLKKEKVGEIVGFDPSGLESKVVELKAKATPAFGGSGMKLGSGAAASASNPDDVRAARLRALQASAAASSSAGSSGASSKPSTMSSAAAAALMHLDDDGDEEAQAAAALRASIAASKARAGAGAGAGAAPPTATSAAGFVPNSGHLSSLVEFGFSREKAYRALKATHNSSVEAALEWLDSHQDDKGIDDPIPGFSDGAPAASSSSSSSAMAVDDASAAPAATATTTVPALPAATTTAASGAGASISARTDLTDEDKAAILAAEAILQREEQAAAGGVEPSVKRKLTPQEVQELLAKRKAEKAAKEKEEARLKELKRRAEGQQSQEIAEQIIEIQKKQQADKIRQEKEAKERETRRLKIEMIRDKIERHQKMHPGVPVPHELMDQLKLLEFGPAAVAPAAGAGGAVTITDPRQSMQQALQAIALYKAGIGHTCAVTIRTLNKNAMEHPDEAKYRSINLGNDKIKERISSVRGGLLALMASGWVRNTEANTMTLTEEAARDRARLQMTLDEIDAAVAKGAFNE